MKWRKLTAGELGQINAFDFEHNRNHYTYVNRTRFYKFLIVMPDGDVQVRTVACIVRRSGPRKGLLEIKEVIRASADSDYIWHLDVENIGMCGYRVDWSPESCGPKRCWSFNGKWERTRYDRKSMCYKLYVRTVNPEALKLSGRFTWCAWNEDCGDVLDYLKLYKDHPRIELLAKAGVGWLSTKVGFVKRLERNKALMSFVSRNIEDIRETRCGVDVIDKARREGLTVREAYDRVFASRSFRSVNLHGIDAYQAVQYLKTQDGLHEWEYGQYLKWCAKLGMDFTDSKVAFPRCFIERSGQVQEMHEALERKKNAAQRKQVERGLKKRAALFGGIVEKVSGGLVARIPQRESEFYAEGKKLGHCVGEMGYAAKMARGESLIVFVRSAEAPDKPFVTVELNWAGKVLQCYGKNNTKPADEVLRFVEKKVAPAVARIAKREAAKTAKKPAAPRQQVA